MLKTRKSTPGSESEQCTTVLWDELFTTLERHQGSIDFNCHHGDDDEAKPKYKNKLRNTGPGICADRYAAAQVHKRKNRIEQLNDSV